MKCIINIENKYYIESDFESDRIKYAMHGQGKTLQGLADALGISFVSLFRKMKNKNGAYFTEMEVQKLMEVTGLIFDFK